MTDNTSAVGSIPRREQLAHVAVGMIVTLGFFASVLVAWRIAPHQIKPPPDPSFIDTLFASRIIVGIVRIGIIFLVVYVLASIMMGLADRRYLTGVGPIKTDITASVKALREERDELRAGLSDAEDTIEGMKSELRAYEDLLEQFRN